MIIIFFSPTLPSTTLRHRGWNFSIWFWSFYNTKFTESCWNDSVFEFPKKYQRCSRKHTNFNAIEIMCLRQAQAPCNKSLVAELVEATMCGIFVFILITQSSRRFCWNDGVFEFSKEHQRCSIECTDFNAIEIMCLREAQAPCNGRFGGWACRSHQFCFLFLISSVCGVAVRR